MSLETASLEPATPPMMENSLFANAITNGKFTIESFKSHDGHILRYGKLVNPNRPASDKALLFVPGLGGTVKCALHFLNILLPNYSQIYVPDLRGYGLNKHDTHLHSVNPIIHDLKIFHETVLSTERQSLDLAGISLGGVLATLLATKYQFRPQGYEKLALLVPAFEPSPVKFTTQYVLKNTLNRIMGQRLTRLPYSIEALTQNPDVLTHPEFQDIEPLELSFDYLLHVRLLGIQALKSVRTLTIPTLIAIADKDYVCDPRAMRRAYKSLPENLDKHLLEYPDLYHDILLEREVHQIGQTVSRWLNPI